jgi:hypothetical protein
MTPVVKLLSVVELSRRTGLPAATIRHHLAMGDWPGVQVGRRKCWRVPVDVATALLHGVDPGKLKREAEAELGLPNV